MSSSMVSGTTPSVTGSPATGVANRANNARRTEEWSAKRMSRSFDRDDAAMDEAICELQSLEIKGIWLTYIGICIAAEKSSSTGFLGSLLDA